MVQSPEMDNKAYLSIEFSKLGLRKQFHPCSAASGCSWLAVTLEVLLDSDESSVFMARCVFVGVCCCIGHILA